jgi:hypothetical protein
MADYKLVWNSSEGEISRQPTLHGPDGIVTEPDSVILHELIDKEQKHSMKERFMQAISLNREVLPEYRDEIPDKGWCIILHYSPFRELWDWLIILLCIYAAIIVPYNITFKMEGIIILDLVIDLIFFIDIVMNFRTTYVTESGKLVVNQKDIALLYLKTWFVIDFISFIPLELYFYGNGEKSSLSHLIHLPKLLRLSYLGRFARNLVWRGRYTFGISLLVVLIILFSLASHWLACVWVAIGRLGDHYSWFYLLANNTGELFYYSNGTIQGGPDNQAIYVTALYYSVTSLTTVGFGNIAANTVREKVFAVCVMIIGALFHALIFGNVTAIIAHLSAHSARYRTRYSNLHEFIRVHEIKDPLKQRLLDHFHALWLHTRGVDTNEVFGDFPEELQADVCMYLNRTLLSTNPVFAKASPGCLRKLSLKLKFMHSAPGEFIAHQGDPLNKLFFVDVGSLEILVHNEVMAIVGNGDVFGQNFYADSKLAKTVADVRALSYCDLTYIHRDDLLETFQMYPEFGPTFSANVNISYDLRVDGRATAQDWRSSPFRRRRISTLKEEDEQTSLNNVGDGPQPDIRVTFQLGDEDSDIISEASDATTNVTMSREPARISQSDDVFEGCDSGVADEAHSVQHQKLEIKETSDLELHKHIHRLEHRLMRLEVNLSKVVQLLERPSMSGLMYNETSL